MNDDQNYPEPGSNVGKYVLYAIGLLFAISVVYGFVEAVATGR